MKKNWLYFFLDEKGKSFYEASNGSVLSSDVKKPLVHTPDGWQDISIAWERDMKEHGVNKAFTFPLKAVRDSLKIVRNCLYRFGVEFKLFLLITWRKVEFTTNDYADYH